MDKIAYLVISAFLMILSYPASGFSLLVCFALAPALIATRNLSPLKASLSFGLWAWVWWVAYLWWVPSSLINFSHASTFTSLILLACVCLLLALPYALSGFSIAYFRLWNHPLNMIQIPLTFTIFISLFSTLLPASPVNALFEYPLLLQWADVGGVPLLVFLYCAFNVSIANVIINKKPLQRSIPSLLLIPAIVLSYGQFKLSEPIEGNIHTLRIGYIQPNATPSDKLSYLIAQTNLLKTEQVELIIWPEVPVDFSWDDNQYDRHRISQLAQELNTAIIVLSGFDYVNDKDTKEGHFNSAHFISKQGVSTAKYHKQKLVPFFEYLPFKHYLSAYFPEARNYHAGKIASLFPYKELNLAPLICYEALFTDLVRTYIDKGADIIINPGNDGWFGESGALGHLSLSLFRTIEYGIPLVRVNNSGISTVINKGCVRLIVSPCIFCWFFFFYKYACSSLSKSRTVYLTCYI